MEGSDVRGVEVLEIFALKLDVFQGCEGGELGETEERDDGVDEGMRRGGGMGIAVDVDWESVRESRGQGAEEDRNRGGLWTTSVSLRICHWLWAHLEWIKDECPDIALPCTFELVHGLGCSDTRDDYKPFLLKSDY